MSSIVDPQQFKDRYLFSALTEAELGQVASHARHCRLAPDQHLFFQGDKAARFFLVLEGQVILSRLTVEGNEKVVEVLRPGQTFAEATLFMEQHVYPVTATAIGEAHLIGFCSQHFLELLTGSPATCLQMLGDLAMRLRRRLEEIEHLSMKNASYRVTQFLLNELERAVGPEGELQLRLQKQVIASKLSIKPETLSRILQSLRDQGVIETTGRTIRIKAPAALRDRL